MKRMNKLIAGMLAAGGCRSGLSKNGGKFAASFNER